MEAKTEQKSKVEVDYSKIDVKALEEEHILKRLMRNYILGSPSRGENKGKCLIMEQQIILEKYYNYLFINPKRRRIGSLVNDIKALYHLGIFKGNKPYSNFNNDDINEYLAKIRRDKTEQSYFLLRNIIKRFFVWLGNESNREFEFIKDLKGTLKYRHEMDESKLFTPEDIKKILISSHKMPTCSPLIMYQCLLMMVYECALRISEALYIRIGDIVYEDGEYRIMVDGKTGKRRLLFIISAPYLNEWLELHPFKVDSNCFLFMSMRGNNRKMKKHLAYNTAYDNLRFMIEQAGLQKKFHPHLLRHSRLNYLAKYYGFNERDLRKFAGWTMTSNMSNVYLHYDMDMVDDKIRQNMGLNKKIEEKKKDNEAMLKSIKCPECSEINPNTNIFCGKCKFKLVDRGKYDDLLDEFLSSEEGKKVFSEVFKEYLRKRNL